MKMEVFTDKLYKEVAAKFGGGIQAEAREIRKNNGVILHGLLVKRQGRNVAATIYLDRLLEAYESGISFQAIARKVLDICQEEWDRDSADMEFFRSFDRVRDRICCRLVSRNGNERLLGEIPYTGFLDLAVTFFYAYHGELGDGMIQINNSHMEMWKTCPEELAVLAEHNTPRLFPWECGGLLEVLEKITAQEDAAADSGPGGFQEIPCGAVPMMVLSNTAKTYGAACILYPGVLEEIAGRTGHDIFILPSSTHEVVLLPDTGIDDCASLKEMVRDINSTLVAPEEVLSDTLYRYDRAEKKIVTV